MASEVPTITILPPPDEDQHEDTVFSPSHHNSTSEACNDAAPSLNTQGGAFAQYQEVSIGNFHSPTFATPSFGLRSGVSGEIYFAHSSGTSSPIDPGSPLSTSSGEIFDTTGSDTSSMYNYDLSSLPASPSMSYSSSPGSLPLNIEDLGLNDHDGFRLDGPGQSRNRSVSLNDGPFVDSGGRHIENLRQHQPRSASVSARFNYEHWNLNNSTHSPALMLNVPGSAALSHESPNLPVDERLFPPMTFDDAGLGSLGSADLQTHARFVEDRYLPPDGSSMHHGNHSRSASWDSPGLGRPPTMGLAHDPNADGNFLTVPSPQPTGLHRRGAHRRAVSHNEEGSSRGRSRLHVPGRQHSPARSASGSSPRQELFLPHSLDTSYTPSDGFHDFSAPPSPLSLRLDFGPDSGYGSYSPSMTSPMSSALSHLSASEGGYASDTSAFSRQSSGSYSPHRFYHPLSPAVDFNINVIPPDDPGLGRRNSYTAGSGGPSQEEETRLQRALSDPSSSRLASSRGRGGRRGGGPVEGTGVFRSHVPSRSIDQGSLEASTSSTTLQQFSGSSSSGTGSRSPSAEPQFKKMVATQKIVQAAKKRRRLKDKVGAHVCPHCSQDFTTRHNLNYHIQSHTGKKQHECPWCGQKSVFPHVIKRHMDRSCKSKPTPESNSSSAEILRPPRDPSPPPPSSAAQSTLP